MLGNQSMDPTKTRSQEEAGENEPEGGEKRSMSTPVGIVETRETPNRDCIHAASCGDTATTWATAFVTARSQANIRSAWRRKYHLRRGLEAFWQWRRQIMVSTLCWKR